MAAFHGVASLPAHRAKKRFAAAWFACPTIPNVQFGVSEQPSTVLPGRIEDLGYTFYLMQTAFKMYRFFARPYRVIHFNPASAS
ncbi:MAG TPA: hypothetical protein VF630_17550 [Hymenobacter sp.]|jgi:hypothetical protein